MSYVERVAWADRELTNMIDVANDPLKYRCWMDADSPWQFLAACKALKEATEIGENYICNLPVSVDGSNNGLQHFSAMLRDTECGSEVNLIPTEQPADIYSTVAKAVTAALEGLVRGDSGDLLDRIRNAMTPKPKPVVKKPRKPKKDKPKSPHEPFDIGELPHFARLWLSFGIDRKVCKRPVMIVPYGGTRDGVRSYIIDAIDERENHPFPQRVGDAATVLSHVVWEVMADLMPGPRTAMKWLQDAANAVSKKNKPVTWTCPSGFLAQQAYYRPIIKPLECYVLGRRLTFKTRIGDQPKLDLKKQTQSFSPNFVHSLDAAALTRTVNLSAASGLTHFACVHDSYGTHASDVQMLHPARFAH